MLIPIALIFLIVWLLGLITAYTFSGFIHLLILPAALLFIISFFSVAKGPRARLYRQPRGNGVQK